MSAVLGSPCAIFSKVVNIVLTYSTVQEQFIQRDIYLSREIKLKQLQKMQVQTGDFIKAK
jgi:hypothetical protein